MTGRETGHVPMGKGCVIRFHVDDNQPTDSVDHHWAETSYDGQPGSWVPVVGSHWHKHHDEYMHVTRGRVAFSMDGKDAVLTPSDPPLFIPRLHVHGFNFFAGEAAAFTERTNPAGDFKERFFGDIFEAGQPTFVSVMRSFYDGDTYMALPGGIQLLDEAFTTVVGGVLKWMYPRKAVVPSGGTVALE
ncbi:hypothetical protein LTS10_008030 [Elasticomyces elasticus]|nr:hypothetical protein LTS10_008030 [Elasticomyces elasticus]